MQSQHDGRDDFDFFIGRWKGHKPALRLKNCDEWEEFEGTGLPKDQESIWMKSHSIAKRDTQKVSPCAY
jgi:hypothetical protein